MLQISILSQFETWFKTTEFGISLTILSATLMFEFGSSKGRPVGVLKISAPKAFKTST